MNLTLAVLVGKILRTLIRVFRKGGGSALPGLVVSKLFPNLLKSALGSFPDGLVVITGSAGKSTTTKMLVKILEEHSVEVFTNPSTANIQQGLVTAILERTPVFGGIPGSIAVLEVDEAHAEFITRSVSPKIVTVLNVMEDQLDRFQDPSVVRTHLLKTAKTAKSHVVLNADDPNLRLVSNELDQAKVSWFGVDEKSIANQKHGLSFSPVYTEAPSRPAVLTEIFDYSRGEFDLRMSGLGEEKIKLSSHGLHYASDTAAAFQTAYLILGRDFNIQKAQRVVNSMQPVFARGELTSVRGQFVQFILVQNPGSMQLNIDNLETKPERLFFAIGRDVHDPSWLWSVDFSNFSHVDVISGFNAAEAELILTYRDIPVGLCTDDLESALDAFFELPTPKNGVKTMIFSADAMRRIRRILGFWDPEEVGI